MMTPAASEPHAPPELEAKPDCAQSLARIEAWFHQQVIDRAPIRFSRHNADYEGAEALDPARWPNRKAQWFDAEHVVDRYWRSIAGKRFHGETFPIFWPNLGPNVFAGCYGVPLVFSDVTSWAEPVLTDPDAPYAALPTLNWQSEYLAKLDEMTTIALEQAPGRFLVGDTDLHPGIDWLAALRGSQDLCFDLYDHPEAVQAALAQVTTDFLAYYDHFDSRLKAAGQPSVTWMAIPVWGRMHIPSCDFATMISASQFDEFVRPSLATECEAMTHNVFHVDGPGVARHIESILTLPNLQAIQWVQGVGKDKPILQWLPLIQRIQAAGKSVVVDLERDELEPFLDAMRPEGIYL
ncbi:MAG: hypothetical protein ACRC1H_07305, partial [Caldilineaceae bacterium]